jgi:predicted RNA binding protein YcfA (HicA-like mRNA interferase family)
MVTRDFSGDDIVTVLCNKGNFWVARIPGDHAVLKYEHPQTGEKRTVSVPLHDRVKTGTLKNIADGAGAKDFEKFCRWIDRNR